MNLFKNIFLFILTIQEKFLLNRLGKTITAKANSKRKKHFQNGCLLTLESISESDREAMEEELLLILKSSNFNTTEILEYIKKHDTKVFYIKNSSFLHSIGQNEGFIYPQKGLKAIYLSFLINDKIKLKTNEMFILTKGEINKYYFLYHFYNWYTYKKGIIGIDNESQELLNKFLYNANNDDFSKLQLSDIYKLKDAIKQDKASIEFVFKLCQKYEGAKKALNLLKDKGANL